MALMLAGLATSLVLAFLVYDAPFGTGIAILAALFMVSILHDLADFGLFRLLAHL